MNIFDLKEEFINKKNKIYQFCLVIPLPLGTHRDYMRRCVRPLGGLLCLSTVGSFKVC